MTQNKGAGEHILVCLSPSPSNAGIVETAARMARAFGGDFTALYVQTPTAEQLSPENRARLEAHIRLARSLGAAVTTVYGSDVSAQIAEFARVAGVTKLVIGRTATGRSPLLRRPGLTDEVIALAPNVDIHIIPDTSAPAKRQLRSVRPDRRVLPTGRDLLITLLILAAATGIGALFRRLGLSEANIITVYILGVLLTALFTRSYGCSVLSSLGSVLAFNYFFTDPLLSLRAYGPDYPVTFAIMLIASLLTGALANKLKNHAAQSAQAAFRTKILFDTERQLQKATTEADMAELTARQLLKLLDRDILLFLARDGTLEKGRLYSAAPDRRPEDYQTPREQEAARWALDHGHRAGAGTEHCADAACQYLAIVNGGRVYGVVGIHVGDQSLDAYASGILLSILGECGLAMENCRNAREKELAAVRAENEQLRADLLRSISHDLRTPLTSISGNADALITSGSLLDEESKLRIYRDIWDDAMWLNLLSVTRIEDGRMQLRMTAELVSDVLEEALERMGRRLEGRAVDLRLEDELLLARMDARLIVQVLVNLMDNAVKYTPPGSPITLSARREGDRAVISVADLGPGIPDPEKSRVFEMFYTGLTFPADSRRSLGLGLSLCRSAVRAHGGEISVADNQPHGSVFSFTLPCDEVKLHE